MIRELIGDALIAAGEKIRGGAPNVDLDLPAEGGWESEGLLLAEPFHRYTTVPAITPDVVRSALDDLSDSKLLRIAATIIAGWKPILLSTAVAALTDVDLLVQALRDRADQFEAVEADADAPFLTPVHLDEHLSQSRDRN